MKFSRLVVYLFFTLLIGMANGCGPAAYTAEDLAGKQAKFTEGVVTKQSRGSFVLTDRAGKESTFRTGEMTQYLPEGYRSQEDDQVRVAYTEEWAPSGKVKLTVLQLQSVHVPPQNAQVPNPIRGELVSVGRGSSKHSRSVLIKLPGQADAMVIYIPYDFGGLQVNAKPVAEVMFDWQSAIGSQASVTARRVPIIRGNAYLYEAQSVSLEK